MPIVVVSHPGPVGEGLAAAVEGLPASLIQPADVPPGAGWFGEGLRAARERVRETEAALLWPVRFAWVDPETVTSLIEAHGGHPDAIVRAEFDHQPGFPILVPRSHQGRFAEERVLHGYQLLEALVTAGEPERRLELGDPGIVMDVSTPRDALPPYQGPPKPPDGPAPEWNAELGARAQESERRSG